MYIYDPFEAVKTFEGKRYGSYCAILGTGPSPVTHYKPVTIARYIFKYSAISKIGSLNRRHMSTPSQIIKKMFRRLLLVYNYLSRIVRKRDFCLCENKGADQLRGNREADQRLCFRYTNSTISLLLKSEISSF